MADVKQAWDEVGDGFESLGLKLKMHMKESIGGDAASKEVENALQRLREAVDQTFNAIDNAVTDQAVREDVRSVGGSLTRALSATFAEASDQLRRWFDRTPPSGPGADETPRM